MSYFRIIHINNDLIINNFNLYFPFNLRVRLQQLERESEDLDQSFQAYLRRQQIMKQQMTNDASKIWENYSLSKAALSKYDSIGNQNINIAQQTSMDQLKMDQFFNSTFKDDIDVHEVLKDLNEIRKLKSPPFDKNEAFSKENLLPLKTQRNSINLLTHKQPVIDYNEKFFETQLKATLPEYKEFHFNHKEKFVENEKEKRIEEIKEQAEKNVKEKRIEMEKYIKQISVPISNPGPSSKSIAPKLITTNLNESLKSMEIKLPEEKPREKEMTGTLAAAKITNGKNIFSIENTEKKTDFIEATILNDKKNVEKGEIPNISEEKKVAEATFNPLKLNGFHKTSEFEPKSNQTNGIEKQPESKTENSPKTKTLSQIKMNGFSSKLPTFVSRVSDSDSIEEGSEQISIGAQRAVKSPDDFWI